MINLSNKMQKLTYVKIKRLQNGDIEFTYRIKKCTEN